MPPTTQEAMKNGLGQGVMLLLASAFGGYVGVQVTLARMSGAIDALDARVRHVETYIEGHHSEAVEFRERIARLEARQEQVMLNLRMR